MTEFDLTKTYNNPLGHVELPYPVLGVGKGLNPVGTVVKTVKGAFNFNNEFNGEDFFPFKIGDWQIPDEPAISLRGGNKLVITGLNRGDRVTDVIEEINVSNIVFNVRGTLYSQDEDQYPFDLVGKLRNILVTGGIKEVSCPLLDVFNIKMAAIRDWKIPQGEGRQSEQDYWIQFVQDTSIELELLNNE